MSSVVESEFLDAGTVARRLGMSKRRLQNRAAAEGALWRQCARGVWHQEQVRLMEAERAGAIPPESGEARWSLFKIRLAEGLPPER
jgi:hypothetical protein